MEEDHFYNYFQLRLTIEDIKLLHYSVEKALEMWAGGEPEEQMALFDMRSTLRRMILDYTFNNI